MMKKIFLLGLICLVLLSACSTNKDTGYTDVASIQIENTGNDINVPEESTSDIRQTSPSEMHESEQSTAAEEISEIESQTEMAQILKIYEGEYCDDNGDPSLEIQLNEDGSYFIQISLFREIGYDACIGSLSEEKMSFTSDQHGGVSGSITLDNDLAVVQFEQIGYFENSKVTTYLFHKTSDNPNIDKQT